MTNFKNIMVAACSVLLLAACSCNQKMTKGVSASTANAIQHKLDAVGSRVYFAFDKSTLTAEAEATVKEQAKILKSSAKVPVTIEGNCDERGTREYNLALGERRAHAVKKHLEHAGIHGDSISVVSYGKERPIATGNDESAHAKNRNAATVVGQ